MTIFIRKNIITRCNSYRDNTCICVPCPWACNGAHFSPSCSAEKRKCTFPRPVRHHWDVSFPSQMYLAHLLEAHTCSETRPSLLSAAAAWSWRVWETRMIQPRSFVPEDLLYERLLCHLRVYGFPLLDQ